MCENLRSAYSHLDGQKQISKGIFQSSYPNYLSQLHILNQRHALVYKTKPSKQICRDSFPFYISDIVDLALQFMENGVVMLWETGVWKQKNTSPHIPLNSRQLEGTGSLLAPQRPRLGLRETPAARISICHTKFRLSRTLNQPLAPVSFPFHFLGLKHKRTSVQRRATCALHCSMLNFFIHKLCLKDQNSQSSF